MSVDLSQVTILIKTFLRDECLFNTIRAIEKNLPECRMSIVDDGRQTKEKIDVYTNLLFSGHTIGYCKFDSGFGFKSNMMTEHISTSYALIGSDDFDFSTPEARAGMEKLVRTLDDFSIVDIASGRVNNRPYEFWLDDSGDVVREIPVRSDCYDSDIVQCDLTVNYCLTRREVFRNIRWDDDVKIGGGEHGAFFIDCKRQGITTVYVPGVNINEQCMTRNEEYRQFRARANSPERPCFEKRGIRRYILGNGTVDYDAFNRD